MTRKNKKIVMSLSALVLGMTGIALTFFPGEILSYSIHITTPVQELTLQLTGALYFAFAMLNWMSKGSHLGGIYTRPVIIANLTHFLVAGLAIVKQLMSAPGVGIVFWIAGILCVVFALLFTWILFSDPVGTNEHH